jgi:lipopolysaccharide transport system permease protein
MGFIGFNLLSGLTRAASTAFVAASATMKSTRQPLSSYVLRDVTIEFIQFGHNMVYYVIFLASGLVPLSPKILIAVPIVLAIAINGFFGALWLGPTVARFRDVGPLVSSVLQVLIFFTPIFYRVQSLGSTRRQQLLAWNPFTYLLGAFRSPLIGAPLRPADYIGAVIITVANVVLGFVVFSRCRSRLPYWVA